MMELIFSAFALGNAAILTNACLLPLYPGLLAFLAGGASPHRMRRTAVLGILVLAGIMTTMLILGLILASVASLLSVILPVVYLAVIVLGVLMLTGRNPFERVATAQTPILRNPYLTAYLYGVLFGPMTLPCTAPVVASAFLYGVGTSATLADGITYFLAFGFGFGWPLVVIPFLALPFQRQIVGWLAQHQPIISRAAGILMIAVGVFGMITEILLPHTHIMHTVNPDLGMWLVYWAAVALLIAVVIVVLVRRSAAQNRPTR